MYNTNFPGNNLKHYTGVSSVVSCQNLCRKEVRCMGFTYDHKNRKCWIKEHVSGKDYDKSGLTSGYPGCACGDYGAYYSRGPSTTVSNVANIELCYKLCKYTSNCYGWTYDLKTRKCELNNNSSARNYLVNGKFNKDSNAKISGPKDCKVWRCEYISGDNCTTKHGKKTLDAVMDGTYIPLMFG